MIDELKNQSRAQYYRRCIRETEKAYRNLRELISEKEGGKRNPKIKKKF